MVEILTTEESSEKSTGENPHPYGAPTKIIHGGQEF